MSIAKIGWSGGKDSTCATYKRIEKGDKVVYETRFGTRSYVVSEIKAIEETDWDDLLEVDDVNKVTMITCIEDQPTKRLMVQATQR